MRNMKTSRRILSIFMIMTCLALFLSFSPSITVHAMSVTPLLQYTINSSFNGTSTFIDKSSDISTVANLSQGSIVASFKSTSTAAAKAILSVSDTSDDSSNLTLSLNDGDVYFEVRDNVGTNNNYMTKLRHPNLRDPIGTADYNDGKWHTVVVTVGSTGTKIYVDGYQVHAGTSTAFFSSINNMNGMWIGKNVDSNGSQWFYSGEIGTIEIYDSVLSKEDILSLSPGPVVTLDYTVNSSFNGSSDYIDKTADLSQVSGLTKGSIMAKFKTTSTAAAKAILSASHKFDASSNITLSINNGNLYFEVREHGIYLNQINVPGNYNDGQWHSVIVTVDSSGTRLYADGSQVYAGSSSKFFSAVTGKDGMWIGRNVDSGGGQWYYSGDIAEVSVFDFALNQSQVKYLSGAALLDTIALFDNGYAGSTNYRIPSIITTTNGTLIAGADQRISSAADSPNNIDFVIRRSTDNGNTWSTVYKLLDYPGIGADGASVIDSCIVQDEQTGTIFVLIDHFPGGIGQANSQQGIGFDANGYKLLYDTSNNQYTLRENGQVYDANGILTDYVVDSNGNVTLNGNPAGNIYLKAGVDPNQSLLEARTAFLLLIKSDDDGVTWSDPIDLNPQVKANWMKFIGTGPGRGIQLKKGAKAGRLIFPIYYSNSYYSQPSNVTYSNAAIYSDDHGVTWQRGESPNDGRVWNGSTLDSQTVSDSSAALHESQLIELSDGTLKIYMRNSSGTSKVAISTSSDGGQTWGDVTFDDSLPEPFCMLSVIKYPDMPDQKERVLFSNATRRANSSIQNNVRVDGVVRLSEDGGSTWKYSKMLKQGVFAYSCLTILPNGEIGFFWEMENDGLYFTKFPLSWFESP